MAFNYVFGPVPSRRLGVSLGIDLIPHKTCTFDCIYCECGKTTNLTATRREYVPTGEVIEELDQYLSQEPDLDYITFSGSGEPLLHSGFGEICSFLKENYPKYELALLTNATLFQDSRVLKSLSDLDLIIPSLDAATDNSFREINRPLTGLKLEDIIQGLTKLARNFKGEIWLEIFIVPGLNDKPEELEQFSEIIEKIKPDKIQLNTLDRPGTENWVKPVSRKKLEKIADKLGPKAEVIANFRPRDTISSFDSDIKHNILRIIRRRPCTLKDLSESLNLPPQELNKYIQVLLANNSIRVEEEQRGNFFVVS